MAGSEGLEMVVEGAEMVTAGWEGAEMTASG